MLRLQLAVPEATARARLDRTRLLPQLHQVHSGGGDVPVDVEIRSEVGVALLEP